MPWIKLYIPFYTAPGNGYQEARKAWHEEKTTDKIDSHYLLFESRLYSGAEPEKYWYSSES